MKKVLAFVLALCMVIGAGAAMADGAIKISTIGPLTGPYAAYGLAVANALKLTVEEVNAQGGLQFEVLEPQDDQGAGDLALNAYYSLQDQGMQILLGTVTSGACMTVAGVAVNDRMFMLTPSASQSALPPCRRMTRLASGMPAPAEASGSSGPVRAAHPPRHSSRNPSSRLRRSRRCFSVFILTFAGFLSCQLPAFSDETT